jgi:hypothetical protein
MHRVARWISTLTFGLALACGAHEDGTRASLEVSEDEAGSTRAGREEASVETPSAETRGIASGATESASEPSSSPSGALTAPAPSLTLSRLEGTVDAEDGAGHVAPSDRAIAVDLDASRFPPRALDPVLHIGSLRFTHYGHPRIGVLRFVVAGAELLVPGSEVSVAYPGDETRTVVVSPALVVPPEVR